MPSQGAIIAVLATAGLCSSFMFTLMVPIQSKLPELLNASREDTAWVVTSTLLAAAVPAGSSRRGLLAVGAAVAVVSVVRRVLR